MSLVTLFNKTLNKNGHSIALRDDAICLTYQELDVLSNNIATAIKSLLSAPGSIIALCLTQRVYLPIAMLSILKAGHSYVVIDGRLPDQPLNDILKDANPSLIITDEALFQKLRELRAKDYIVTYQQLQETSTPNSIDPCPSNNLAYVVYTSGSTGKPKGTLIEHQHICDRLASLTYNINQDCTLGISLSPSFDAFPFTVWLAWANGATLIVVPQEVLSDPIQWVGFVERHHIDTMILTPVFFRHVYKFLAAINYPFEHLILGGDVVESAIVKDFLLLAKHKPVNIYNAYGPTEIVCIATTYPILGIPNEDQSIPIGKASPGTYTYVLDENHLPVKSGSIGELYIGGCGVVNGYLNQPELTKKVFLPDPFNAHSNSTMYKTGDLVKQLSCGNLEFVGRKDRQVKIRGIRVELEEIEHRLRKIDGIRDVCVIAENRSDNHKYLIAYIELEDSSVLNKNSLRQVALTTLPYYMMPSKFVVTSSLPTNINGKIDRNAIKKAPTRKRLEKNNTSSPIDQITEIWAQVLGLKPKDINPSDDFFGLGGDSIMAIEVTALMHQKNLFLDDKNFFDHPTVADLARIVKTAQTTLSNTSAETLDEVPATPIQSWFMSQEFKNPHYFLHVFDQELKKLVNRVTLEDVLNVVTNEHKIFGLRIFKKGSRFYQKMARFPIENKVAELELAHIPQEQRSSAITAFKEALFQQINLESGPLLKMGVIRNVDHADRIIIAVHHLIIDGVSWRILLQDIESLINQKESKEPLMLKPSQTSYLYWSQLLAEYAHSEAINKNKKFWRRVSEYPNNNHYDFRSEYSLEESTKSIGVELSEEETSILTKTLLKQTGAQINAVLLSALFHAFHQTWGDSSIFIDVEGHGREPLFKNVDISRTIGWFTTLYPVHLEVPVDVLDQCHTLTLLGFIYDQLEKIPNKGIDYGILKYLTEDAVISQESSTNQRRVRFNYLGNFDHTLNKSSVFTWNGTPILSPVDKINHRTHDIVVESSITDGVFKTAFAYGANRYSQTTIKKLSDAYIAYLKDILSFFSPKKIKAPKPIENSSYPLSPIQQGLWFHKVSFPDSPTYWVKTCSKLKGVIDLQKIKKAWKFLYRKHEALRISFEKAFDGTPMQVVSEAKTLHIDTEDWFHLSPAEQQTALEKFFVEDKTLNSGLAEIPPSRLKIIRCSKDEVWLLWSFHHILLDGWSTASVMEDFLDVYNKLISNVRPALTSRPSYKTYVEWIDKSNKKDAREFWKKLLGDVNEPTNLSIQKTTLGKLDKLRSSADTHRSLSLSLEDYIVKKLQYGARKHKISLSSVFQSAWAYLLGAYSNSTDVIFGTTVAIRPPLLDQASKILGNCINSIPLRINFNKQSNVGDFLESTKNTLQKCYTHSSLPLHAIQQYSSVPSNFNLFETLVVFENYPTGASLHASANIEELIVDESTEYPLTIFISVSKGLSIKASYNKFVFDNRDIEELLHSLVHVCQSLIESDSNTPLTSIDCLSDDQKKRLCLSMQGPSKPDYLKANLGHLIIKNAKRHPNKIAIQCDEGKWTYKQLLEFSDHLIEKIRSKDVKKGDSVILLCDKIPHMVGSMLGAIRMGLSYIPVSPSLPQERLEYILADSSPAAILVQSAYLDKLSHIEQPIIAIDNDIDWTLSEQSISYFCEQRSPNDIVNIFYTSGTTGSPKGVMVQYEGFINYLMWFKEHHSIQQNDVFLQITSFAFDISAIEIFVPLIVGGSIVIPSKDHEKSPSYLAQAIIDNQVTALNLVPSTLNLLIDSGLFSKPHYLRNIFCGGDVLTYDLLEKYRQASLVPLFNYYGPTEASIYSTLWDASLESDGKIVPIGKAICNTNLYILTDSKQHTPIGAIGELHIGGVGVAKGYLNKVDITEKSFFYSEKFADQLYATGDIVKQLPNGELAFIGRKDTQIKLNGLRIELADIDYNLSKHPHVLESVTLLKRNSLTGDHSLCSFVVLDKRPKAFLDAENYSNFLKTKIPSYMIPSQYIAIETVPLNSNGKTDRTTLLSLAPTVSCSGAENLQRPLSPSEEELLYIWSRILPLKNVSATDNFFGLGGDSLSAIKLLVEVEKHFSINFELKSLFENPTLEKMSAAINKIIASKVIASSCQPNTRGNNCISSCILQLNHSSGTSLQLPLFAVHPVGGTAFCFMDLAQLIEDRPFYAIQDPGIQDPTKEFGSIDEMAEYYIAAIKIIQPSGPYYLSGSSFGATVAFEMTSQLEKVGEKVAFLGLFDGWGYYPKTVSEKEWFKSNMECQYQEMQQSLQAVGLNQKNPWAELQWNRWQLLEKYTFKSINTPITLFKSETLLPVFSEIDEPTNHWQEKSISSIEIIKSSGDHLSLLQLPNAINLKKQLQKRLASADSTTLESAA